MSLDEGLRTPDVIWGKSPEATPYPLQAHLLDSWVTAGAVWDHWLRPALRQHLAGLVADDDLIVGRRLIQTAALLHDSGKTNPVFQTQAADRRHLTWREAHIERLQGIGLAATSAEQATVVSARGHPARRHEYVTGLILGGDTPERLSLTEHWLIQSVTGHHGKWHEGTPSQMQFTQRMMVGPWDDLATQIATQVIKWAGGVAQPSPVSNTQATQAIILTNGLVVLADWIASLEVNVTAGQELINRGLMPGPGWVKERTEQLTESVRQSLGWYTSPTDPRSVVLGDKPSLRPLQAEAVSVADQLVTCR